MSDLYFHRYGKLIISNFYTRKDFEMGGREYRHIIWVFWWEMES